MNSRITNSVGKRVYRGGSFAPNRGKVNPGGYIKREVRKRGVSQIGGDGMSDTRSGLAKAALARMQAGGGRQSKLGSMMGMQMQFARRPMHGGGVRPVPPGSFGGPDDGRPIAGSGPRMIPPGTGFGGPDDGRPIAGPRMIQPGTGFGGPGDGRPIAGGPAATGPAINPARGPVGPGHEVPMGTGKYSPVQINKNGRLDLPFDFAASQEALNRQQQANEALFQLQQEGQQHDLDYLNKSRGMAKDYELQQRGSLGEFGSRGTVFSSGYGNRIATDANDYNQGRLNLDNENTRAKNYMEAAKLRVQQDFNDFLQQQGLARGHELGATKAGTLGLGTASGGFTKGGPRQQPKGKPKPKPKPPKSVKRK